MGRSLASLRPAGTARVIRPDDSPEDARVLEMKDLSWSPDMVDGLILCLRPAAGPCASAAQLCRSGWRYSGGDVVARCRVALFSGPAHKCWCVKELHGFGGVPP